MAETTGVRQAATARTRPSSENGSRSSRAPPPRAMTMTSTSGSSSRSWRACIADAAAPGPWTGECATVKRAGQRRATLRSTSRSASESLPVISPMRRGSSGSGRLRWGSNRPSAWSLRRRASSSASNLPTPATRSSRHSKLSDALGSHTRGFRRTATCDPSGSGPAASSTKAVVVTEQETSANRSLRVRNWVGAARRLISMTCASTQISPSLPTQSATAPTTRAKGCGCSGELVRAMSGSLPMHPDIYSD